MNDQKIEREISQDCVKVKNDFNTLKDVGAYPAKLVALSGRYYPDLNRPLFRGQTMSMVGFP